MIIFAISSGSKARTVPLNASARRALAVYLAPRFPCDPTVKAVVAAWPKREAATTIPLWQSQKRAGPRPRDATDD